MKKVLASLSVFALLSGCGASALKITEAGVASAEAILRLECPAGTVPTNHCVTLYKHYVGAAKSYNAAVMSQDKDAKLSREYTLEADAFLAWFLQEVGFK